MTEDVTGVSDIGAPPDGWNRRVEVEQLLAEDDSAMGRQWRMLREGHSVAEVAEAEGVTTGPVYASDRAARLLLEGEITTSPSVATGHASRLRVWLKTKTLSDQLRAAFEANLLTLEAVAADKTAQDAETAAQVQATEQVEATGRPGIYVYVLPHYQRYPMDPETGRTLLKVGHSAVDAFDRSKRQTRITALPEDPILLRVYPTADSAEVERQFHSWLRSADHGRTRPTLRAGSEWFLTSTKFLDRVATSLNLDVIAVNEIDALDD
ncbi:GIY-YIG nuclease family protein [Nocardioides sp. BGMRC 2183]|nr:GIY-YIG nuclease family protein [Nocardioides sp. BGMRC 2183]